MTRLDDGDTPMRDAALAWFVRLQSGDATATDRAEHQRWLAEDPSHPREYAKLASLWSDLDGVADPRVRPVCLDARARSPLRRRSFLVGGAMAAGVAGLAVHHMLPDWLSDFSTGTGEQRTVSLSDGSVVNLDADTSITLAYDDQFRRIRLLHGRAFFDVAKDAARPFVVEAASGSTTALGTRFVVHEWADTVTVSVEESAVSVVAPDQTRVVIKAGENVSYARGGLGAIEGSDVDTATAWRRGKLIFEDRPLRQVIADVNRYRHGTIQVIDSGLLNLRVSGIFDVLQPDGVLDAITTGLPVRAIHLTRYLVLLRPA